MPHSSPRVRDRGRSRTASSPATPPTEALLVEAGDDLCLPPPPAAVDAEEPLPWIQCAGPAVDFDEDDPEGRRIRIPPALVNTLLVFEARCAEADYDPHRVSVWVAPDPDYPAADAGTAQVVAEGEIVLLDGRATRLPEDISARDVGWEWVQVEGPPLALSDPWSLTPAFRAPEGLVSSDVRLELRVTHGADDGVSSVATLDVLVCGVADQLALESVTPSTANAGDVQTLRAVVEVEVDARRPLNWRWRQVLGPPVALDDPESAAPSFPVPLGWRNVALAFEAAASDGQRAGSTRVELVVEPDEDAPRVELHSGATAADGDRVEVAAQLIGPSHATDDAASADDAAPPWQIEWLQLDGPTVRLQDLGPDEDNAQRLAFFAPDLAWTRVTLACVARSGRHEAIATTTLEIEGDEDAPEVDAGPSRFAQPGATIELTGHANAADGTPAKVLWRQLRGPRVPLSDASSLRPRLRLPEAQADEPLLATLVFALHAFDGDAEAVDTVRLHLGAPHRGLRPSHAGAHREAEPGERVRLGTWSEDELGLLERCSWRQVAGPPVVVENQNGPAAWFRAPTGYANTRLVFSLDAVLDGERLLDTVEVLVEPDEDAPQALVAADRLARPRELVRLAGVARDPGGLSLRTRWRQVAGPPVELDDPTASRPTFAAPVLSAEETLVFEFAVDDGVTTVVETAAVVVQAAGIDAAPSLLPAA